MKKLLIFIKEDKIHLKNKVEKINKNLLNRASKPLL